MSIVQISNWLSPNSVSIFAQPPGQPFVQFLLTRIPSNIAAGHVRLDLAESETHSNSWQITRNPVEAMIAQNRIRNPEKLSITGMLSANPLLSPLQNIGLARLDRTMLLQLRVILKNELLFIVTPEGKYPNMACVSLVERHDDTTGNGVQLTMEFEEIQFAVPGFVPAALDLDAVRLGTASADSLGPTAPTEVVDPGGLG